jgi:predicted nucleic acid-binding protein
MKTLILDSSSIISLSLNSLLDVLRMLKKNFDVRFVIPPEVKHEVIDNPLEIRRFELEALMISKLIEDKVIEIIDHPILKSETEKYSALANSMYSIDGESMRILHSGEAGCLALSALIKDSVIVIDERTTRMICENPGNFRKLLEDKLHENVQFDKSKAQQFSQFKIIRSSELAYIALEKKLLEFPVPREKSIEAVLFALKLKGCAISRQEIEDIESL